MIQSEQCLLTIEGTDGPWCKLSDVCWLLGWDGSTMIQSGWCLRTIVMGWIDHDTKWTIFAHYCDGMDGPWYKMKCLLNVVMAWHKVNDARWLLWWIMIQSERCLLTNNIMMGWMTMISSERCLLIIMMEYMDYDNKWTTLVDNDGMDGPWYKVNDVCWLLWWNGWTIVQSEQCLRKVNNFCRLLGWNGWTMIQSERWLLTRIMGWMDHDTKQIMTC